MVAAKLAALGHGQRQSGQLAAVPTQEQAAQMLNVGERTVRRAREVLDDGSPELIAAVERGDVSVSAAALIVLGWLNVRGSYCQFLDNIDGAPIRVSYEFNWEMQEGMAKRKARAFRLHSLRE